MRNQKPEARSQKPEEKKIRLRIPASCFLLLASCFLASPLFAQVTFSGNVTPTGNVSAQSRILYAFEDFEDGEISSPWTANTDPNITVSTEVVKNGTKAARIAYATTGTGHVSDDSAVNYVHASPGIFHSFSSAWVYLKTPTGEDDINRKIFYHWADPSSPALLWSVILTMDDPVGAPWPGAGPMYIRWVQQNEPVGGTGGSADCGSANPITGVGCALAYDTWYFVEMEIQANTALAAPWDGEIRIWVTPNGGSKELVWEGLGWSLNRTNTNYLRSFLFGEQVDVDNAPPQAGELRYLDDLSVTNYQVGP